MLWRRKRKARNIVLEYFFDPNLTERRLLDQILEWSIERASAIGSSLDTPMRLYAGEHNLITLAQADFSNYGFTRSKVEAKRKTFLLIRELSEPILPAPAPAGFTLESLSLTSDLETYADLYSFTDVSPEFRKELLARDEYIHLVLTDSVDDLVAFCEYSDSRAEWERGAEKLGWIDYVGTRGDQAGQCFGALLLTQDLGDQKAKGAETAMLVTISDNHPAM
jgi:hypothetical protein